MALVRFQVAYWRVSERKKKTRVGGRCVADGRETHTKMRRPKIPWQPRLYPVITDGNKSQIKASTSPKDNKNAVRIAYITSCDS